MTEEKHNRIIAAVTVNAILLILILALVLVYQMVVISSTNKKRREVSEDLQRTEQASKDLQNDLETRLKSEWYFQELVFKELQQRNQK